MNHTWVNVLGRPERLKVRGAKTSGARKEYSFFLAETWLLFPNNRRRPSWEGGRGVSSGH